MTTKRKVTVRVKALKALKAKFGLIDWATFTAKDADKRMGLIRGLAGMKGATV